MSTKKGFFYVHPYALESDQQRHERIMLALDEWLAHYEGDDPPVTQFIIARVVEANAIKLFYDRALWITFAITSALFAASRIVEVIR